MEEKESRRSMSVFPIGAVVKLTDLSTRQIRYYEEQDLIHPERSGRNRRVYSLNGIGMLLEIKDYLSKGLNMAGVGRVYEMAQTRKQGAKNKKPLIDHNIRQVFRDETLVQGGLSKTGYYQLQGLQRRFFD